MSIRVAHLPDGRKAIIIRTSDRIAFKQCRRKWGWSSHLKRNLAPKHLASPLWFGSGIHYALEDFHGYNHFKSPAKAFLAYCIATSRQDTRLLPPDAQEHADLGVKMMDYYQNYWLRFRKTLDTYWAPNPLTGELEPQVEVNFEIEIPLDENPHLERLARAHGADCILYCGTIDRVGIDEDGNLWIIEYKTAKRAEAYHFQTDPQITTYVWAGSHIYDRPVVGIRYYQYIKTAPESPRILGSGKISTASNLVSSYPLYYEALEKFYGSADAAPKEFHTKLAQIGQAEGEHYDRYVRRDIVRRNTHTCNAEAAKILLEIEDMINPDLPLYPNPTRQCPYMCSFLAPCVTMDDGGDWEYELEREFGSRDQDSERFWRKRLPPVESLIRLVDSNQMPNLEGIQQDFISADETQRAAIAAGEMMGEIPTFRM
jgi:hypothetical protein